MTPICGTRPHQGFGPRLSWSVPRLQIGSAPMPGRGWGPYTADLSQVGLGGSALENRRGAAVPGHIASPPKKKPALRAGSDFLTGAAVSAEFVSRRNSLDRGNHQGIFP